MKDKFLNFGIDIGLKLVSSTQLVPNVHTKEKRKLKNVYL